LSVGVQMMVTDRSGLRQKFPFIHINTEARSIEKLTRYFPGGNFKNLSASICLLRREGMTRLFGARTSKLQSNVSDINW